MNIDGTMLILYFLTPKYTTLKLHDPQKFQFSKFYLVQKLLLIKGLKKGPQLFPSFKSSYGLLYVFISVALHKGRGMKK